MGANVKLTSLGQFATLGCNAGVRCMCGHTSTVVPAVLIAFARRKGWAMDCIDMMQFNLKCTACGRKGSCRLGWSWDKPTASPTPKRPHQRSPAG